MDLVKAHIDTDFVVMSPDKKARVEHWDDTLYQRLDANYGNFAGHELVSCHSFDSDWPTWEIHPHGDEMVILMSGEATFLLQVGTKELSTSLTTAGEYIIIPANTWHTAKVTVASKMLFITPGQDTENRPV